MPTIRTQRIFVAWLAYSGGGIVATSKRSRKVTKRKPSAPRALHTERFPGESPAYRRARNKLLKAEIDLRRQIETVAALRRKLPHGGVVREDYVFEEAAPTGVGVRQVKLSELFAPGKNTLILYSFMFGPAMEKPCQMCTSLLDSLEGNAHHVTQRVNFAVAAKSPVPRILEFAAQRGWRRLRLLSSSGNSYNRDYHGEGPDGDQWPILNVFEKEGGTIRHFYATELLFAPVERGMNHRHVDLLWPLWNMFDLTPEGRGTDWYPELVYES